MENKKLIFIISFIEGGSLMMWELLCSKIVSPFYGNSIAVWTSVISTTLIGLACGYYFGSKLSIVKHKLKKILILLYMICVIWSVFIFVFNHSIQEYFIESSTFVGSFLSLLIINFPILLVYGCISPLLISYLNEHVNTLGKTSSKIYTLSTFGGVLATFFVGLCTIPYLGVILTFKYAIFLNILNLSLLFFITQKLNQYEK